ncbi:GntR family transcriptional regulator [Streptomyces olivaceus]|uniref:GntR family transcriptional regulator n=1 Tax=Streptomyces olivaceus TaxID=47716 RepID=A0A0U2XLH7_STROV|nr:GntR family transcriptional regulator [Streptomyces olivaceus]ALS54633.1 GntR family transcriptional regulator [Streptomyces olivaceus]MBZ6089913.1 GntR family transcriptional regulator [Streptomyces olivaceus]MBZ6098424.1 GntR family transcriptional regulator [Streptomyces olivaceus]MBZ6119227.1 GntR family transcriptional regulator [Streptomyces olivaceus]MBZ6152040.1 GntR family transcriptional regulator [Streptomyces olivaceus]
MLVSIDHSSSVSLAEQIAASVRRGLVDGSVRKGDRLPPARSLARTLDINMHTVLRGYQILKNEHLIDMRPGRGAVVTADAPASTLVTEACRHFVALAQRVGMSRTDILDLLHTQLHAATQGPPGLD